jgi:hypothetical protein
VNPRFYYMRRGGRTAVDPFHNHPATHNARIIGPPTV